MPKLGGFTMQHIDAKFKDQDPKTTVEKIRSILESVGLPVEETWNDSGLEHCYSLIISGPKGIPFANGKGVTPEFARASAYGEFIERLQSDLFFYKFQSIRRNPGMSLHAYAPDAKYMTVAEIIANGEWMDYLIEAYGPGEITRETIAEYCRVFACTEEEKILTIPFYSLFEKKSVYIPAGFMEQMYISNGCCAGNTREEAWVHALSEIMERYCTLQVLTGGAAAPRIPEETLRKYSTVSKILDQLRADGEYEVDIFDYSIDNAFPVISTRIISKTDHSYRVNVAADPVLEIAIQRTLTEMFQGSSLKKVTKKHGGTILNKVTDISQSINAFNQLENGSGFFTADFFADELTCNRQAKEFSDQSGRNNQELMQYMLDLYRRMGKQIYVRNCSYLGFPTYKVLVPGFSEAQYMWLKDIIPEYAMAEMDAKTYRNPTLATDDELGWLLIRAKNNSALLSRNMSFNRIAGIPISSKNNSRLVCSTRAYAAYRLKRYSEAISYMAPYLKKDLPEDEKEYLDCIARYLQLKTQKISEDKIRSILYKFFHKEAADRLYEKLNEGKTPYEDYLMHCDFKSCENCAYNESCSMEFIRELYARVGAVYNRFTEGQDPKEFVIE